MSRFKKISKFSLSLLGLLLILAFLTIITFRGIFSAISTSRQVDEEFVESQTPRLDKEVLDKAYEVAINKKLTTLDLRE